MTKHERTGAVVVLLLMAFGMAMLYVSKSCKNNAQVELSTAELKAFEQLTDSARVQVKEKTKKKSKRKSKKKAKVSSRPTKSTPRGDDERTLDEVPAF